MNDDYLWNGVGVDPELEAIERTLAPLRYDGEALRLSVQTPEGRRGPERTWARVLPVGAALAAFGLVWVIGRDPSAGPPDMERFAEVRAAAPVESMTRRRPGAAEPSVDRTPPPDPTVEPGPETKLEPSEDRRVKPRARRRPRRPKAPRSVDCILDPTGCGEANVAVDRGGPEESVKVECVLDPAACERASGELPAVLTSDDIRKGIAPLKPAAQACGEQHAAPPGTTVKVKMSVAGKTGRVTSAVALDPWVIEPLGVCVAGVLAKARFPRFRKERLGIIYPIVLGR